MLPVFNQVRASLDHVAIQLLLKCENNVGGGCCTRDKRTSGQRELPIRRGEIERGRKMKRETVRVEGGSGHTTFFFHPFS